MPGPNGRVAGTLGTCERYGGGKGLDRAGPEAAGGVVGDPGGGGGPKKNPPGLVRSRLPVLAPVLAAGAAEGEAAAAQAPLPSTPTAVDNRAATIVLLMGHPPPLPSG